MDEIEYKKFLNKLFPSKHLAENIKKGEQLKKMLKKDADENSGEDQESSSSNGEDVEEIVIKTSKKNNTVKYCWNWYEVSIFSYTTKGWQKR